MPCSAAVAREFRACAGVLEPSFDGDDEGDILNALLLNRAQLWRTDNSALITQLVGGPEPYLLFWKAGGRLEELMALRPVIEAWARMQGAVAARLNGRKGWRRVLHAWGAMEKDHELWKAL